MYSEDSGYRAAAISTKDNLSHFRHRVKTEVKTEEDSEENGLEEKVDFVGFSGTENTDFTLGLLR